MTLAVCIIARDEEELLPQCLDSLHWLGAPMWDELIIGIDDRTSDRTYDIAERYGAKIIDIHWPEDDAERDFAAARNEVERVATSEYVYVQDADEKLVSGHEAILTIVREGKVVSARPIIVTARDEYGNVRMGSPRQDVLHRRGSHRWMGKFHEWTEGPLGEVRADIQVEQIVRSGGDRPHGDTFANLRANMVADHDPFQERHLFYLLREHATMPVPEGQTLSGHEQEVIALAELLVSKNASQAASSLQRSHACIFAGHMANRLDEPGLAHDWYIRAVKEWGAWAEPYFHLGVLCHDIANRHEENGQPVDMIRAMRNEAAGWLLASTAHEEPAYFVDSTLYAYRRYQALAVVLARVGKYGDALMWMKRASAGCPENAEFREQAAIIEDELQKGMARVAANGQGGTAVHAR